MADHDENGRSTNRDGVSVDDLSLDEARAEIAAVDRELVELIARRTYAAEAVAKVKEEQGLPTTDESQEERVLERATRNAERFDLDAEYVRAVFRKLIELNKVEQKRTAETDGQREDGGFEQ